MCVNPDQPSASNNQFFGFAAAANQVKYTAMAIHTTRLGNRMGSGTDVSLGMGSGAGVGSVVGSGAGMGSSVAVGAGVCSGMGFCAGMGLGVAVYADVGLDVGSEAGITFGADNGMSSGSGNGLSSDDSNGMGFGDGNDVGSDGGNDIGSGAEVGTGGDPGEGLVCFGTQPVGTATGLAFSGVYITSSTSSVAGRGHPTPASSVSWAVKPPHLFSCAKVVSVLIAIRPFEKIQDAKVYNEFPEVASDNKE